MKICPTITATNTHQYRNQLERVGGFARAIHIDFMDGKFVDSVSPGVLQSYWPKQIEAHFHLMIQSPETVVNLALEQKPALIIVHAEAETDEVMRSLRKINKSKNTKSGLALLQSTQPGTKKVKELLELADHVLIFSGRLGHHGGEANMELLKKVKKIKKQFPKAEIGWDGGVSAHNAKQLMKAGVDVFNVGGYIQQSEDPKQSYKNMKKALALL